jgi:hypothetical protein
MYHLGTAAFGSLIIAVIKTIRSVLAYIQKHAKASKNKVVEYLMCVLQCCMWCLEKCAKFLNKNAYIQTSIYGFSFCKSSRRAFFLILRNILRISVVNAVADFVLILGKVSDIEFSVTVSVAVPPTSHPIPALPLPHYLIPYLPLDISHVLTNVSMSKMPFRIPSLIVPLYSLPSFSYL